MRWAVPNGGSGVVGRVGGFKGAVTYEETSEDEGRESTSIGVVGESPAEIGDDGNERIGTVSANDATRFEEVLVLGDEDDGCGEMGER
jgi:hypothetical protein